MCGIIEVPEPFYDYGKKDKAAVAARWALETAASATVEAEKRASQQAAVQQAKADKEVVQAVKAAKAAAKAAKRAAKKAEKKTEKAAGDKRTKRKVASSFHGVIGILLPILMLFVALGQSQRG